MNAWKITALIVFIAGFTLVILGGVYNPYTDVVNLPQGGFRGIGFSMYEGETVTYHLSSLERFTVYIMNSTEFQKLMNNGTFNGSYYTQTGKIMNLQFRAPKEDVYYIVIANFNSQKGIEVDFAYRKGMSMPLFLGGSIIVAISVLILIVDLLSVKRVNRDKVCPECGRKVSGEWNYCPYCRHELRGDEK